MSSSSGKPILQHQITVNPKIKHSQRLARVCRLSVFGFPPGFLGVLHITKIMITMEKSMSAPKRRALALHVHP